MSDRIIPLAPLDRLIKSAGAKRVSQDAREKLAEYLEEVGLELSQQALVLANHASRCTVTASDFIAAWHLIYRGVGKGSQKF